MEVDEEPAPSVSSTLTRISEPSPLVESSATTKGEPEGALGEEEISSGQDIWKLHDWQTMQSTSCITMPPCVKKANTESKETSTPVEEPVKSINSKEKAISQGPDDSCAPLTEPSEPGVEATPNAAGATATVGQEDAGLSTPTGTVPPSSRFEQHYSTSSPGGHSAADDQTSGTSGKSNVYDSLSFHPGARVENFRDVKLESTSPSVMASPSEGARSLCPEEEARSSTLPSEAASPLPDLSPSPEMQEIALTIPVRPTTETAPVERPVFPTIHKKPPHSLVLARRYQPLERQHALHTYNSWRIRAYDPYSIPEDLGGMHSGVEWKEAMDSGSSWEKNSTPAQLLVDVAHQLAGENSGQYCRFCCRPVWGMDHFRNKDHFWKVQDALQLMNLGHHCRKTPADSDLPHLWINLSRPTDECMILSHPLTGDIIWRKGHEMGFIGYGGTPAPLSNILAERMMAAYELTYQAAQIPSLDPFHVLQGQRMAQLMDIANDMSWTDETSAAAAAHSAVPTVLTPANANTPVGTVLPGPPPESTFPVLPPDWDREWSDTHHRFYYYHRVTRQTTWDRPSMPPPPP